MVRARGALGAEQAVGSQPGAYQSVDGADDDVTEVVHAPVHARVGDEEGNERAHPDHGPSQPGPLDGGGHDGEGDVERDAGADMTAGVARGRWGWVQMRNVGAGRLVPVAVPG